jgi:hypothetical protein
LEVVLRSASKEARGTPPLVVERDGEEFNIERTFAAADVAGEESKGAEETVEVTGTVEIVGVVGGIRRGVAEVAVVNMLRGTVDIVGGRRIKSSIRTDITSANINPRSSTLN